jgi:hypothetical protein
MNKLMGGYVGFNGPVFDAPTDVPAVAPVAEPAPIAEPVAAPVAAPIAAEPTSVLYPAEKPPVAAPVVAEPVVEPVVDPNAPAGPDVTGLSPEDAAAVKEAWDAKAAAKETRKAELEAMSPADRAIAEKADADAEVEQTRLDTVPTDGVYDLKMPDGVELDADLLKAISPDLAELGLSNGQAQKMADTFIKAQTEANAKAAQSWAETLSGWVDAAKADPEIGGAKWDATVKSATGALAKFGSPALADYLNNSGGGNNPEMIRAWAKVGAAIAEDAPPSTETPAIPATADKAAVLYPHDLPKGK